MPIDLDALLSTDLSTLDQDGLQERAVAVQRTINRLTGHLHDVLGELHQQGQGNVVANLGTEHAPVYRLLQHWWRDEMKLTGSQAGRQVRHAATMRELPVIAQAVRDGWLQPEQARVLARLHGRINLQDLQDCQPHLVEVAQPLDTDALGRFVSHLIATHCEPALEADQDAARERRYLQLRTDPDGTVHGRFLLAGEDAEAMLTVLEPLARKGQEGDDRSAGQRRADALVDVFAAAANWMDLPHAGGQRAQVSYVITSEWCAGEQPLGLPEALQRAGTADGIQTGALARYAPDGAWTGPQTRSRVEAVLCDARISRMLLDPKGVILSLESLTDSITTAQRRAVSIRDRHCVAKGCTRPPAFCDVHHLTHREHGGATSIENLVLLCRRHHVLWHLGKISHHHLHLPWLPLDEETQDLVHDPWSEHSQPLIA